MNVVHVPVWTGTPPHAELWDGVTERVGPSPFDGQEATFNIAVPRLEVFVPDQPNGTSALICPGGGFHQLSMDSEGRVLAGMLVERGVTAAVLAYRLVPTPLDEDACRDAMFAMFADIVGTVQPYLPALMLDVHEAVRVLRRGGAGFAPAQHVAAIGFSAGARLVGQLALTNDATARVDAAAIVYMASLLIDPIEMPDDAPPLFVLGAADDPLGISGGRVMLQAWLNAGRPVEDHLYERGGHGFGTNQQGLPIDSWPDRWFDWLTAHEFF